MEVWKCASCSSQYEWIEPNLRSGHKLCDVCAEDPDAIKRVQIAVPPVGPYLTFFIGFLAGMIFFKMVLM